MIAFSKLRALKTLLTATGVLSFAVASAVACGGSTSKGSANQGVRAGDPCSDTGASAPSEDGCNTCTCAEGTWACTEKACTAGGSGTDGGVVPGTECTPGDSAPSADGCNKCFCDDDGNWVCTTADCVPACADGEVFFDGCNECTCVDGGWACTDRACPMMCPAPTEPDPGVACPAVVVVAKDPVTGMCCEYPDPCHAPAGWKQFYSQEECNGGTPTCANGDMMSPDGCNTCSCLNGQWACTLIACAEERGCGGWLGNTCTDAEYCAYVEGEMCGAADASSVCKPRPTACDTEYAPVCACNGQTYGNACEAAADGWGVYSSGTCR